MSTRPPCMRAIEHGPMMADEDRADELTAYLHHVSVRTALLSAMLAAMALLMIYFTTVGPYQISFWDSLRAILDNDGSTEAIIIWNLRLPRVVADVLVGAARGVAGAIMQCVLRNPLASPFTLGVSNAAAFGAAVGILLLEGGIVLGQSVTTILITNPYVVTGSAFLMALVAIGTIVLLVRVTRISPEAIVLTGVAISSVFGAGLAALQYFSNESALANIVHWQFGDLGKINWDQNLILLAVLAAAALFFFLKRWDFNAMDAGDEMASGLGVNTDMLRIASLVMASLLTAVAVSFVGVIGFIGLLAPHVIRRLIGNDHRFLIPGSMLLGSLILLVSDTVGRNVGDMLNWFFASGLPSFVIPVGIITSFIGGPLFIYILVRGYRNVDQG